MKKTFNITRIFNRFIQKETPLGRWQIAHLKNKNNANSIVERKMDLANLDSCYCNEITKCLHNKNYKNYKSVYN